MVVARWMKRHFLVMGRLAARLPTPTFPCQPAIEAEVKKILTVIGARRLPTEPFQYFVILSVVESTCMKNIPHP
jgi:hypothetical protein